ncbi:hypothetical protein K3495_g10348 [Podosphaera aphanis]|nr:hypothetical protein K3495_g10348 [Podosphaera aphanis]
MSVSITSPSQFSKLLDASTLVVADFYADWCGPCKAIAPTYESLAIKYSKPHKITFAKVNVDSQPEISQRYGVRAMPTFMIFRSGTVIKTISGADVRSLTSAIESAVKLVGPAGPVYSSVGRTLGSTNSRNAPLSQPQNLKRWIDTIVRFLALYFTTLFSLDAYSAGEQSPFNVSAAPKRLAPFGAARPTRAAPAMGKKLGTIADLGGD